MLRYTILDIIINDNDNISQETFECFTEAIEENPKIDLIKYINQEIGEIGDTQHRIILRYDDVFKLTQSYLYYNSNAAIDSGKPVNAEPTTCSISIIVVCGTNV